MPSTLFSQSAASVEGPTVIKAGETAEFRINLDRATNIDGLCLSVVIQGPGFGQSFCPPLPPGKTEFNVPISLPAATPGGTYTLQFGAIMTGVGSVPIKSNPVQFRVIPRSDIVLPTEAIVRIQPSQIQLLRTESLNLQQQIQDLKAQLLSVASNGPTKEVEVLLARNLSQAQKHLEETAAKFQDLYPNHRHTEESETFFRDLKLTYERTSTSLRKKSALNSPFVIPLWVELQTAYAQATTYQGYPSISQGTLRAIEQNELAYNTVAANETFFFDLVVKSNPEGALVSYHLRGDPPKQNGDPTNTTIKNLTYAIWMVRVEKPGYKAQEREHDPFVEPYHVMNFELQH